VHHPVLFIFAVTINALLVGLPLAVYPGLPASLFDVQVASVVAIVSIWLFCEMSLKTPPIHFYRQVVASVSGHYRILYCLPALVLLAIWIAVVDAAGPKQMAAYGSIQLGGFLLCLSGICLRYLSISQLGPYFSAEIVVVRGQKLVTSGIFRRVRHPSYTGLLGIVFGIQMIAGSIVGIAFSFLVILPFVLVTVTREDQLLHRVYGSQFDVYQKSTGSLFPVYHTDK
jgi:protein-S-isoprenylcysteine O-methyltransferase Ste14